MIINIDDERKRLKQRAEMEHPEYCPFVVSIWKRATDREGIFVRRKTLQKAQAFVEDVTGLSAIRWVVNDLPGQLYAFTGKHTERYSRKEYRRPEKDALEV